jgi:hypothetical protein
MTPTDLQNRAQYLSLALFSQKILTVLMQYVDENKVTKLKPSLQDALKSLEQAKRPSFPSRSKLAVFTTYEHLRTLDEVWSNHDRANAERMIRAVIHSPKNPKTKAVANELIRLFSELQNQALWNFEQPQPVPQRIIQRLCQPV